MKYPITETNDRPRAIEWYDGKSRCRRLRTDGLKKNRLVEYRVISYDILNDWLIVYTSTTAQFCPRRYLIYFR